MASFKERLEETVRKMEKARKVSEAAKKAAISNTGMSKIAATVRELSRSDQGKQ